MLSTEVQCVEIAHFGATVLNGRQLERRGEGMPKRIEFWLLQGVKVDEFAEIFMGQSCLTGPLAPCTSMQRLNVWIERLLGSVKLK